MSAPKVTDAPAPVGRRIHSTGWLIGMCLALFVGATYLALGQSPRSDPLKPATLKNKMLLPYEENAFMRLPAISGNLNDIFVTPKKGHIWGVGSGGLIIVSRDNGRSWERKTSPISLQMRVPSAPNPTAPSSMKLSGSVRNRVGWGIRSADAASKEQFIQDTPNQSQDIRQQAPAVKVPEKKIDPRQRKVVPEEIPIPLVESPPDFSSVFFVDETFGWIAGSGGLILSTGDGGNSWRVQPSGTARDFSAIHFIDRNRGWACGSNGTILVTLDGGANWQVQRGTISIPLKSIYFTDRERGWACGNDGTILSTIDGGLRWRVQSSGTTGNLSAIHFADHNHGWACGDDGTIVSTTDGGATWRAQNSSTSFELNAIHFADRNLGWICGTGGTILITHDGGMSWRSHTSGTYSDLRAIHFKGSDRGWASGAGGAILSTTDGGSSWQVSTRGNGLILYSIYFADPDHGWASGTFGTILSTTDGGASWQVQSSGTWDSLFSIRFSDLESGRAWGQEGSVLSTMDGGGSWQAQSDGISRRIVSIHFSNQREGWACGASGTILSTRDGGVSWQAQVSRTTADLFSIHFTDGEHGWACGSDGAILSTRDGGASWQTQASGIAADLFSIHFTDGEHGWACGSGGTILSARDGGASWQMQVSGIAANLSSIHFIDRERGWICGKGGTILSTIDGGLSWRTQDSGTSAQLYGIHFKDRDHGWACGTGGTILSTADGGQTWRPPNYRRLPAPWYWSLCLALILVSLFVVQRRGRPEPAGETVADLLASDRPLEAGDPDPLNLRSISSGLARFISNRNTDPPLTIAVTGEWGTGKSSLMNLLYHDLKKRRFQPVWFNAWHHQKGEQLLASLYAHIRNQAVPPLWHPSGILFRLRLLFRRGRRNRLAFGAMAFLLFAAYPFLEDVMSAVIGGIGTLIKALATEDMARVRQLFSVGEWLSVIPDNWIGALLASPAVAAVLKGIRAFGLSPQRLIAFDSSESGKKSGLDPGARSRFAQEFQDVAASLDLGAMVIFIDDLDRCSKENVVEILETINFLAVSGRCFIILGMARQWVETCVALQFKELAEETGNERNSKGDGFFHRRQFARQYLEKLINIEVPVPLPSSDATRALLTPQMVEPISPMARCLAATGKLLKKYAPVICLALLAALACWLQDFFKPVPSSEQQVKREELLVLPAGSQQGELVLEEGRIRIPLNETTGVTGALDGRKLEIVLKGLPQALEEGLAIGTLGKDDRSAELVLRYKPQVTEKTEQKRPEEKEKPPQGPEDKTTDTVDFQPGAEDTSQTGHWLAVLLGLGLLAIAVLYLVQRPQRFTADSKTFRDALAIWHPWIVLVRRTPRTIKRFLNRLRYVAMRLKIEPERRSLWERIKGKLFSEISTQGKQVRSEGVPEPVLVALGAIYHVHPGWLRDVDILRDIFSKGAENLIDRLKTAFPELAEQGAEVDRTSQRLTAAISEFESAFGHDVEMLIQYREAFLAVLAETGI